MAKTETRTGPLPRNFDGSKKCWNCDRASMVATDSYYVCSACGASWNSQPKPQLKAEHVFSTDKDYTRALAHGGASDFTAPPP